MAERLCPAACERSHGLCGQRRDPRHGQRHQCAQFVLDYGQATEGLDQSALLQYIPTGETVATQTLTFNSTAGATQIINPLLNPAFPITQPNDVGAGNIGLQVGSVNVTVAMDFDDPGTTAAAIQAR